MSVVYLRSNNGSLLALDVTTNVSKSRSSSITSSSVQSGASVADGYTLSNPTLTFSGVCTATKIRETKGDSYFLHPYDLDLEINSMMESQEKFILYGSDLIPNLEDVVITNYSTTQSQYEDTVDVNITVEQVFVSEAARLSDFTKSIQVAPSSKSNGAYENEVNSGDGKKTEIEASKSLLDTTLDYYGGLFTGLAQ